SRAFATGSIRTSASNVLYLYSIGSGVTEPELAGEIDVGCHWTDRTEVPALPPFFQSFQCDGIQSHRVLARIQRGIVHRVIRLRLRPPGILRDEAVHQIQHHFFCAEWIGINFGETSSAEPRALSEPAPVIDVRDGHVVNATRDAIRFTD